MKRKAAISFMLTLLMVASTISIVGSKGINNTLCPGAIDFNKEVWNDNYWDETLFAEVGDTVTFRINLTYYRDLTNPDTYRLKDIKIKDELPDCLEFANLDNIYTSEGQTVSYTQEFSGKMIYWNLTANQPELDDNESLYIIFNAYVIESEELQNQNIAYVDAMEDIWHPHTADDDAWVYILEPVAEPRG